MKVLVIPDVHLKPWMFDRASDLMKTEKADQAVCLMDIPDDWNQELNLDLYMQTYDRAVGFAQEYPDTLWCYGNHDLCYPWNQRESGYSKFAVQTVCMGLNRLKEAVRDVNQIGFIQRIDNVLFCHGGLLDEFVKMHVPAKYYHDVDKVVETINGLGCSEMWQDDSPIWYRPQYYTAKLYKPRKLLQVVGHTPVRSIERKGNLISCDVFSTYRDGRPIGTREFPVIDTEDWTCQGVR